MFCTIAYCYMICGCLWKQTHLTFRFCRCWQNFLYVWGARDPDSVIYKKNVSHRRHILFSWNVFIWSLLNWNVYRNIKLNWAHAKCDWPCSWIYRIAERKEHTHLFNRCLTPLHEECKKMITQYASANYNTDTHKMYFTVILLQNPCAIITVYTNWYAII